jgi:hypothetical protein
VRWPQSRNAATEGWRGLTAEDVGLVVKGTRTEPGRDRPGGERLKKPKRATERDGAPGGPSPQEVGAPMSDEEHSTPQDNKTLEQEIREAVQHTNLNLREDPENAIVREVYQAVLERFRRTHGGPPRWPLLSGAGWDAEAREWWRWEYAGRALAGYAAGNPSGAKESRVKFAREDADALVAEMERGREGPAEVVARHAVNGLDREYDDETFDALYSRGGQDALRVAFGHLRQRAESAERAHEAAEGEKSRMVVLLVEARQKRDAAEALAADRLTQLEDANRAHGETSTRALAAEERAAGLASELQAARARVAELEVALKEWAEAFGASPPSAPVQVAADLRVPGGTSEGDECVSLTGEQIAAMERSYCATFLGGYHQETQAEIFRHGMTTVFNGLRAALGAPVSVAFVPAPALGGLRSAIKLAGELPPDAPTDAGWTVGRATSTINVLRGRIERTANRLRAQAAALAAGKE